jgi:hypothetical protein
MASVILYYNQNHPYIMKAVIKSALDSSSFIDKKNVISFLMKCDAKLQCL